MQLQEIKQLQETSWKKIQQELEGLELPPATKEQVSYISSVLGWYVLCDIDWKETSERLLNRIHANDIKGVVATIQALNDFALSVDEFADE